MNLKNDEKQTPEWGYTVQHRRLKTVQEELKQRINTKASKIRRLDERTKWCLQNKLLNTKEKRLYRKIMGQSCEPMTLKTAECQPFWSNIWISPMKYDKNANWLQELRTEKNGDIKKPESTMTPAALQEQLKKWKTPGLSILQDQIKH